MKSYTYLLVDLGAILIPFIFSFHPKLKFYKKWKSAWFSILIVAIGFVVWDIYYTKIGVWGFTDDYLIGIDLFGLPVEEILFFICIPYACLFTYHCFKLLVKDFNLINPKITTIVLIVFMLVALVSQPFLYYTTVTFIFLSIVLIILFFTNPKWLPRLYLTLLVLIVPFLIVNGILTGTGLETQVVWYNSIEFMGFRVLTIPIEDFFYGMLMIIINVIIFELLGDKRSTNC